ncbi:MAG: hypothetical protein CSA15_11205 [Candidatus Delongbacteria bacterium]|nr:MAG: hypothetical protein CSA15_11205 [Candidatus Delongbacteria bacterium]
MKFLYNIAKKYLIPLSIASILLLISTTLILPIPFFTKRLLDYTIPNKDFHELLTIIGGILLVIFFQKTLNYLQGIIFYKINNKIIFDIKISILKILQITKISEINNLGNGYIISKLSYDTENLRSLFADNLIQIFKNFITLLIGLFGVFYLDFEIAILLLILVPIYLFFMLYFGEKIKKETAIYSESYAKVGQALDEFLSSMTIFRLFNRNSFGTLRYTKTAISNYRTSIVLGKLGLLYTLSLGLTTGLTPLLVYGYGGYKVMFGDLTLGSLIAINSFIGYIFTPIRSLVNLNISIKRSLVSLNRIIEFRKLSREATIDDIDIKTVKKLTKTIEKICFKKVLFSYSSNEKVLNNLTFEIKNGEKVAIVGSSGSGKSTIIKLLTGLEFHKKGEISINNYILSPAQLIALRKEIAVVEQEPFLFNDTIYNNIKLGKVSATKEDVYRVSKMAYIDEFIKKLPNRYETQVGINGNNLSVGQKQRIAIARALLKQPKILILDEATSSIDNLSEKYITETINNLPRNMIVIIVAHRINSIKNCDKIFVMDKGMIKESGTHQQLLKCKGLYYSLNAK